MTAILGPTGNRTQIAGIKTPSDNHYTMRPQKTNSARSGIRTHEANATDLKSVPFDLSGIRAMSVYPSQNIILFSLYILFALYNV